MTPYPAQLYNAWRIAPRPAALAARVALPGGGQAAVTKPALATAGGCSQLAAVPRFAGSAKTVAATAAKVFRGKHASLFLHQASILSLCWTKQRKQLFNKLVFSKKRLFK